MRLRCWLGGLVAASLVASVASAADKVNLGIPNAATDVGFFIADKKGYFRAEGIEVNFIPFDSAARMITPFASGELDVGGGAPSAALFNAVGRGIDIRIVSDKSKNVTGRGSQKLLVRKDLYDSGKVRSLADLRGMKIAISAAGTSASTVMDKFLEKAGLKPDDVTLVNLGFPQQIASLQNGAIDVASPAEPTVTEAIRVTGAVPIANDYDVYPRHQVAVVLYSGKFGSERPEVARKFMRAFLRGVRDHNDALAPDGNFLPGPKGDEIVSILAEYGSIKNPAVYRSFVIAYCDPNGELDLLSMKEDLGFFQAQKLIEVPVTVEKVVDTSFLDWAVKELGPYKAK